MKRLLAVDRAVGKVEAFLLATSLLLMLLFSVYSVAYRNLVSPVVLWLQGRAMEQTASAPVPPPVAPGPAAAPAPAAAAAGDGVEGHLGDLADDGGGDGHLGDLAAAAEGHLGDLADDPPAVAADDDSHLGDLADDPSAAPAAAPVAVAADDDSHLGDLADDPPAAPAAAPAAVAAEDDSHLGDLADDPPAAPAAAPVAVAADDDSHLGDLADDPPAAPVAAAADDDSHLGDLGDDDGHLGDLAGEDTPAAAPAAGAPTPTPPPPAVASAPLPGGGGGGDSWLMRLLKFFNFGWIDVVTRHLLLWVAFFGAAMATRRRKHINIDALSRVLSAKLRLRLRVLIDLVAMVVCVLLTHAAWSFLMMEHTFGGKLYKAVPSWVGIGIIPLGFGLLALHFAFEVVLGGAAVAGSEEALQAIIERAGADVPVVGADDEEAAPRAKPPTAPASGDVAAEEGRS